MQAAAAAAGPASAALQPQPAPQQQVQPQVLQCKCAGLVPRGEHTSTALLNVLRGMCYHYESAKVTEAGLRVPLSGGATHTSLRLLRMDPPAGKQPSAAPSPSETTWRLLQEGAPLRGPTYNDLPCAVRELSEVALRGAGALQALLLLGMRLEYRVQRSGNVYRCMHQGFQIEVTVSSIAHVESGAALTQEGFLVEASLLVGAERHMEAARALGAFADRLLPMVQLKKA